jgi:DNA-directed RNA polymerase subunit M/transcription elongation factor TFIIS
MLVLKCPKCGNRMNYEAKEGALADKVKRCVYCGRSFKVKDRVIKES